MVRICDPAPNAKGMGVAEAEVWDDHNQGPDPASKLVLGQHLARARQAQGWSVDDIATRLNLRSSFVTAVEEGRGGEHMSWGYEKNHIRTIAALLSIDLPLDI